MSIGSSFIAPPTTRRSQLFRQQSVAAPRAGVYQGRSVGHDTVRFGFSAAPASAPALPTYQKDGKNYTYRKNTVWVSTEDPYAKAGGLGEVTDTIPTALMLNSTPEGMEQRDIRVITPFVKKMQTKNDELKSTPNAKPGETYFQPTNLSFPVKMKDTPDGEVVQFRVWQKEEPIVNTDKRFMRYALQSPIFDEVDGLNTYDPYDKTKKSKELLMPFNRGAAKLVHYLKPSAKAELDKLPPLEAGQVAFKAFDDNRMTVIGNDHLSGSVLFQPEVAKDPNIVRGFVYHNVYDSALPAAEAGYDQGKLLPSEMGARDSFSPLTLAPNQASWAVIDGNFAKTILDTDFSNGDKGKQVYVKSLREHRDAGSLLNIHHPLSPEFTPVGLEFLQRDNTHPAEKKQQVKDAKPYQFATLPKGKEKDDAAWTQFKQANKLALQRKYGLNENKGAVLMGWAARLEPSQKGFYMLKNTMEELLKNPDNKDLQIVIAGNVGNPKDFGPRERELDAWVKEFTAKVESDPDLKGRLYFPNRFVQKDEIAQINAACDFTILPSLYEPYGITQLEAYKMGSIPLVHAVDGIRSTVHEPDILPDGAVEERLSRFGQTGVLLQPIADVAAYRRALSRHDMFLDFAERVAKNSNKQYRPAAGTDKDVKEQYRSLKKALQELCDEKNLHLPGASKKETFPEGQEWKHLLKRKVADFVGRLKDLEPITEADIELLKLIEKVDQEKILTPADQKFAAAVNRAMGLNSVQRESIRKNGQEYLDYNHSLEAIGERWRTVLDTPRLRTPEDLEFGPPTFGKPKKTVNQPSGDANQSVRRKPVVVHKKPEGFLVSTWESVVNAFSAILFYLNPINWFTKSRA